MWGRLKTVIESPKPSCAVGRLSLSKLDSWLTLKDHHFFEQGWRKYLQIAAFLIFYENL